MDRIWISSNLGGARRRIIRRRPPLGGASWNAKSTGSPREAGNLGWAGELLEETRIASGPAEVGEVSADVSLVVGRFSDALTGMRSRGRQGSEPLAQGRKNEKGAKLHVREFGEIQRNSEEFECFQRNSSVFRGI